MTIKAFGFLNPTDEINTQRNWRVLDENSKFLDFSNKIAVGNISNFVSAIAYAQLIGPLCHYYIKLSGSGGVDMTSAGSGYITGIPFGAPSVSGQKTTEYWQGLECVDANFIEIAPAKAVLLYNSGVPRITLPAGFTSISLYVYGTVFRDA